MLMGGNDFFQAAMTQVPNKVDKFMLSVFGCQNGVLSRYFPLVDIYNTTHRLYTL